MPEPVGKSLSFWAKGLTDADRGKNMVDSAKLIAQLPSESYRRDYDIFNIRLYANDPNVNLYDFAGQYYSSSATGSMQPTEQSTNNKAKAAIDTLCAQVTATDQRARFMVVDGKYRQRRRAREMQNFSDGLVHELGLHSLKQRVAKDAAILESGRGVIQFYRDEDDRCAAQRGIATEFAIDPKDGWIDGQARTLYRRRPVAKDELLEEWVGDNDSDEAQRIKRAIEAAPPIMGQFGPGEYTEVFEAWRLASSKKKANGWHILALDVTDGWLEVSPYKKSFHECVFFGWEDAMTTAWGESLMHGMRPLQIRINANEYRREKARKLCHGGHLWTSKGSRLDKLTVTNEIGTIWTSAGEVPPQQIKFDQVTAEWTQAIERDGQLIFENYGISVAASQGETNAGLNASAASKREDTAKSDKRNAVRQQRWEKFHLDCVKVALSVVKDIVTINEKGQTRKEASGYKVATPGQRGLTVTDWKDAAMDEEQYVLQIKPASPIPTEPSGQVAYGQQMVEMGAWTPQEYEGFLQDLDGEGRVNRKKANERKFEKLFEALLYDKVAVAIPDEFTDLEMALRIGVEYLAQGEEDEVPEKNLERVRRYLKKCKMLGAKVAAGSQPPPGPPGVGAAPPMPPDMGAGLPPEMAGAPPALSVVG